MLKEPSPEQHELEIVSLEPLVPDNHLLAKLISTLISNLSVTGFGICTERQLVR